MNFHYGHQILISLLRGIFSIVLILTFFLNSYGQKPLNPIKDNGPKSKIELIRADSLAGENSLSRTQTFLGNVIFSHRGVLLGCQKAVHNLSSNFIEAYGKVVINQGDTLTIVGDTLIYDGNLRFARVYGKQVILRDKKVTLRTTQVHYDLNRDQAFYPVPGVLNQDSSRLSSKLGYYNTKTKYFRYIGDVEIINPQYVLCTDSLDYDTYTKLAIFKTFTTIKGKNGDLSAYKGKYNIKNKESFFEGRAKVTNDKYSLEGDTLAFDNTKGSGYANGEVVFVSFEDSLVVLGQKAIRNGEEGLTKVMKETLSRRISKNDTLWIAADTLWVFEKKEDEGLIQNTSNEQRKDSKVEGKANDNITQKSSGKNQGQSSPFKDISKALKMPEVTPMISPASFEHMDSHNYILRSKLGQKKETSQKGKEKKEDEPPGKKDVEKIIADGHVRVIRADFQSVSDSLIYNLKDSVIFFYQKPVLWNQENQLEADTVSILLKNNRLHHMKLLQEAFVIQTDTIKNYNQIKGRTLDAFFDKQGQLSTIKVDGNGESLYFALDEKNKIIGLNKVQCSNMQFYFKQKKIKQIVFRGEPESLLIPPKEILTEDMKLEKFEWKTSLRPKLTTIATEKQLSVMSSVKLIRD